MRKMSSMAAEVVRKIPMTWRMTFWLTVKRRVMRVVVKMLKAKMKTLTISLNEMSGTRNGRVLSEVETMMILVMPIIAHCLELNGGESLVAMRKNSYNQEIFS
jgi:hypothetical protein